MARGDHVKLLATGDWHADWSAHGVDRFEEIERAAEETVDAAIAEKVDLYVFGGDLTDPDSGPRAFRAVELLQRCVLRLRASNIDSIVMAGNHDVFEDGSGDTTLSPLRALLPDPGQYLTVHERPGVREVGDGLNALILPFTASSHTYDPVKVVGEAIARGARPHIVLSHLSVPGIIPGEETKDMPRGRDVVFPFAATSGARCRVQFHYHRRQQFDPRDGGPPILVPGSLARLTFGEEKSEPGFIIVEI